jgi:molecular chaperone DnaK
MTKIIPRNTTIPTKKSETFSTAVDGQSNVEIHVLQGEREMATDNKSLGTFRLDGIPAAPRGVPQIEVTFDIDANGILAVKAKDKGTGKEQSITISGASTLPDNEVERMVKEAERNSTEDKLKREKVEAKNQADSLAYQAEKQLVDLGDKVPAADKTKIDELITNLKAAVASENHDQIKTLTEELKQALYALSTSVYSQGASAPTDGGDDTTKDAASGDDSVIDADFTESK